MAARLSLYRRAKGGAHPLVADFVLDLIGHERSPFEGA
jgi:hypothetical protein